MEVWAVRGGRQVGLDRTALPIARAEVGPANHDGAGGRLVPLVELDLLVAVTGEDTRGRHESKCGSRERRCRPSGRSENPFPWQRETESEPSRLIELKEVFL